MTNSGTQTAFTANDTNATLEDHDRSNNLLIDTGFSGLGVVGDKTLRLSRRQNPSRFRTALSKPAKPIKYVFGAGMPIEAHKRVILVHPLLGEVPIDIVPGKLPFLIGRKNF